MLKFALCCMLLMPLVIAQRHQNSTVPTTNTTVPTNRTQPSNSTVITNQTIPTNRTQPSNTTVITNTTNTTNNTIPTNTTQNSTTPNNTQPVIIPPYVAYNGNCFACVNKGFKYCDRDLLCYPLNTTSNCTKGTFLDANSGCPIKNFCNLTETSYRGVILLDDIKPSPLP